MDSKIGLLIQLNGVCVVTVMCLLVGRSLKLTALKYWSIAWLALSFSLLSLQLGSGFDGSQTVPLTLYFGGEYLFGFLLIAGCRTLGDSEGSRNQRWLYLAPLVAFAIALPNLSQDPSRLYTIHSLVMSVLFVVACRQMHPYSSRGFGARVMRVALGALAISYSLSSLLFTLRLLTTFDTSFLSYNSIVDLVLQTTLGTGMVIVLIEKALSDARSAREELETRNKKLEELAHTDPLTAAFSRHAFHGFVKRQGTENSETSGCVGFFDIDDLKWINDTYGHRAGDFVIRTVVRAIRDVVRAEDLIFRWGGDEFFVIMVSMRTELANTRMSRLESNLSGLTIEGMPSPFDIGVSWGFTDFSDISCLEEAISRADAEMYSRKIERKNRRSERPAMLSGSFGNPTPLSA